MADSQLDLARLLIARLERLSVDSRLAHHASGLRRSLLNAVETVESAAPDEHAAAFTRLDALMRRGFEIVETAAKDMGDPEG